MPQALTFAPHQQTSGCWAKTGTFPGPINVSLHAWPLLQWFIWTTVHLPRASLLSSSYLRSPGDTEWTGGSAPNAVHPGACLTLGNSEKPSGLAWQPQIIQLAWRQVKHDSNQITSFLLLFRKNKNKKKTANTLLYYRNIWSLHFINTIYWNFSTHRKENINIIMFGQLPTNINFQIPEKYVGQNAYIFLLFYCRVGKKRKHKYINPQIISVFRWKDGALRAWPLTDPRTYNSRLLLGARNSHSVHCCSY